MTPLDLLGRPYRLGADGTGEDGAIDCIHLVYYVRSYLNLSSPPFDAAWYSASKTAVLRALLTWGVRVHTPTYDGTVALVPQNSWAFGVTWMQGVLTIHNISQRVVWSQITALQSAHYFWQKQ